jgi:hypothetical protein
LLENFRAGGPLGYLQRRGDPNLILGFCKIEFRSPLRKQLQRYTHSPDALRGFSASISAEQ